MYSKLNRKFYTKWTTNVYTEDKSTKLISEEFDLTNSRVFIVFESSSLGDTLAWMPYCEEFAKKHNCKVLVSTFKNEMFEGMYSDIEFVRPGSVVQNIKALYRLGWFYDKDKEPVLPNTIPLQKTATNILGLDFMEIRPRLAFVPKERPINEKYVTIGMSTTAGCKEWIYPNGWQKLINYLNSMGYKVAVIQKESFSGIDNVLDWTGDKPLVERMNQIHHSEFYIGLGSGLSWLAWAVNKHVVMISNFSEDGHEFTDNTTRIINKSVCNGCWNNPMFMFDKGDWNWCPEHKGTERQFECHKSISSDMVIEKIQHLIK
jgi:autotransporter strand-loop-strand O-heptosyltransferase